MERRVAIILARSNLSAAIIISLVSKIYRNRLTPADTNQSKTDENECHWKLDGELRDGSGEKLSVTCDSMQLRQLLYLCTWELPLLS